MLHKIVIQILIFVIAVTLSIFAMDVSRQLTCPH